MSGEEVNIFNEDTARRRWEEHRKRVANSDPGETIDFRDEVFTEDPEGKYFHGIEFQSIVDFSSSTFKIGNVFSNNIFNQAIFFSHVSFEIVFSFKDIVFKDTVSFLGAIFNESTAFLSDFQDSVSFENAIFKSKTAFNPPDDPYLKNLPRHKFDSVSFDNATFQERVSFEKLDFNGNVSFKDTKFCYWTEFVDLEFCRRISFEFAHFLKCTDSKDKRRNYIRFQGVKFAEKVSFWGCQFECKVRFQKVLFDNISEFRSAKFDDTVEFIDVKTNGRLFLERNYLASFANCEDAIVPYRLAKQSASHFGDSRWSGNYHFQEQCATNAKKRKDSTFRFWTNRFWHFNTNAIWNYGVLILGRYVFGYGEKPLQPLFTGLGVILLSALVFWIANGIEPDPPCSFCSALYFSVVTFTTLGYGDLQPVPNMRWLSAIEAFSGAALMAMFIVALARKFTR